MSELHDILDIVLRTRYTSAENLRKLSIWSRLPADVQFIFLSYSELSDIIPQLWQFQNPAESRPGRFFDSHMYVCVALGFLFLSFASGRISLDFLLLRTIRYCDSYACNLDASLFRRMYRINNLLHNPIDANDVEDAYSTYTELAKSECAKWGL